MSWRNRQFKRYVQILNFFEVDPKLQSALNKHKKIFDDEYCYWLKGKLKNIVARSPLWMGWTEKEPEFESVHKSHYLHVNQKTLDLMLADSNQNYLLLQ